jgi:hypothetical protein
MVKRFLATVVSVAAIGLLSASAASAYSSEYFYYAQNLGANQAVSGVPRSNLDYLAGNGGGAFCIMNSENGAHLLCSGSGAGVNESFGAEFGRGWLGNYAERTTYFTGEEGWG